MKETKFKAWDKYQKTWVSADIAIDYLGKVSITNLQSSIRQVEDIEVVWWTGLKDKNGEEIYEGDIVNAGAWGLVGYYDEDIYIVEFDEGAFRGFRREYFKKKDRFSMSLPLYKLESKEVIGNIYENPELLEELE